MPRPACDHQNRPTEEAWVNVRPLSGLRTVALILPAQRAQRLPGIPWV